MKRSLYDVSRWHLFLYRQAAGLPLVDTYDSREQRLADELFARFYSGDLTEIPEAQRDQKDADWTKTIHAEVDRQVAQNGFADKLGQCKGSVKHSAVLVKNLLQTLPQLQSPQSPPPSGNARDAADGLDQVDMGGGWSGTWKGEEHANDRARKLADRLKDDERLRRIALLAGKFQRIVVSKQKTRVRRGADEISDVIQGDDIARLLPTELARIASPRYRLAAIRDLMERKCLEYQMTSTEVIGRGPLVLCLDKSPSMEGDKDIWASAVALALLNMVHRQHRTFILLGFCDTVFYRKIVRPGRPLPEDALFVPLRGGTDIGKVLDLALHAVETRTVMKRADIVLITDGASDTRTAQWIKDRAKAKDVSILGVGIGVPAESLLPWCGDVHAIQDLNGIDDEGATKLFGMNP